VNVGQSTQMTKVTHVGMCANVIERPNAGGQATVANKGMFEMTAAPPKPYPVWRTITLGVHKSADGYRESLKSAKMHIGAFANDILNRSNLFQTPGYNKADLVVVTVGELGLGASTLRDIYTKAKTMRLDLCSVEIGPAARLAYHDQPRDSAITIAMEPILSSAGIHGVFTLNHHIGTGKSHGDYGLWLQATIGSYANISWSEGNRFMFLRPS